MLTAFAVCTLLVSCGAPPPAASDAWVQEMVAQVNARRAETGASALAFCATLANGAHGHSLDQASRSTMSHTGGNGSSMSQRANNAGYRGWNALAENVAAGQPDVTSVVKAWMGSPGHRANLLSSTYSHIGVGQSRAANGTIYWTQMFGRGGTC